MIMAMFVTGLCLGMTVGLVLGGWLSNLAVEERCAKCEDEIKARHNKDILAGRLWL
jgi:hypothetical protein